MAEPEIFDQAIIYVQGALFVNATSIAVSYEDSDKPIFLMNGKFIVSPGERIMRIAIDNAVSQSTEAHDIVKRYLGVESFPFAIELMGSGLRMTETGLFSAPGFTFAVGQSASYKVGIVAPPAFFK